MRVHPGPGTVAGIGHRAGQQLEEHAPERVLIGATVELLQLDLLGRGVVQAGRELSVGRELHRVTHAFGDAEVGQEDPLRLAVRLRVSRAGCWPA